jgi:mono/diheme cytochrome c family protein
VDSADPGGGAAAEEGVSGLLRGARAGGVLLAAACICGLLPRFVFAQASDAEIDQGREVYGDFCAQCHGRDMVNPGGVTPDLRKFPKDDFERFKNAVLNGKPPAMPPWRDKIGDDDLKLLWAYVRSGG